ncbi:hypothetical protein QJU96_04770 [Pasteurella skyensis]|uniref:ORC1/DEAH AAA+ ATPase domain-containing protein n=1 Tax=Phocoenobacter skyensis TaxID=97481 RepID=A0AAJ6P298_9PAST|nr:AAA family ATPase [Pasteurella skyensis]MDP8170601.1 hypothetical protein [Pasteurella skyensis]MDP8174572.1 hypothetical protein [Pasteurella skyensis]
MKIFGRKIVIKHIWHILEENSILLTAERRIGKTEVLKQLRDESRNDYIVIFSDLEGVSTPVEFVEDILQKIKDHRSLKGQVISYFSNLRRLFDGVEISNVIKIPNSKEIQWKKELKSIITEVCNNNPDKKILFLWDEIPYMLNNIKEQNPDTNFSVDILDTLRELRQENKNLRMIYTGSIGIHHVLSKVKTNAPIQSINDLHIEKLCPISDTDAIEMARYRFIEVEKLAPEIDDNLLREICQFCDNVPYYIEKMIKFLEETPSIHNIEIQLRQLLRNHSSNLNLEHFRARLKDYYLGEIADVNGKRTLKHTLAKSLLNHIAVNENTSIDECFSQLKLDYAFSFEHRDEMIELLRLLTEDHYLIKTDKGYQFAFSMIRNWWIEAEGLEG